MASQWSISRDGEDVGTATSAELRAMARNGKLLPTDHLWKEGMQDWRIAGDFPQLFPPEESATVVMLPEQPVEAESLGTVKIDVTGAGKKKPSSKKAVPTATDPLASLKVDVATAGQKATIAVNAHAKAGGKVAVLTAERTKISTTTLPLAYGRLGEHCYRSRSHADAFPEWFEKLDGAHASLAGGTEADEVKTLFVQLGKACFNQFGPASGPAEAVSAVQALKDRLAKINAELTSSAKSAGGAMTWLMYGGGALLCLAMIGAFFDKGGSGERPQDDGGGGTPAVDRGGGESGTATKRKKPTSPINELASIEQEAYEQGWEQGASEGRKWADNIRKEIARGNPQAMIGAVQENADFYLQQQEIAIRAIQDFERQRGEPCEIPRYHSNRGLTRGKYDGFMSEVGEYLR